MTTKSNTSRDNMIFDQYSRYKACSDLLRQTGFVAGNSVLDIGSGPECLFGQFMPDALMNYVDPLIPIDSGHGRITGNVFSSELDKQVFDCVTAVDVLEHVPPEQRQAFLQRLASLGKKTLVLGFPTSDSSDALVTDKAIDDQYRAVFGRDYSWLGEHYRFGLPSLVETVEQLNQLGWHCQTIGHGHAPWLADLLGFAVRALEFAEAQYLIQQISERFNRELYKFDFNAPVYRQFIIATRSPLNIDCSVYVHSITKEVKKKFQNLMNEAWDGLFPIMEKNLILQNEMEIQRQNEQRKIDELSNWGRLLQSQLEQAGQQLIDSNTKLIEVSEWGKGLQIRLEQADQLVLNSNVKLGELSDWGGDLQAQLELTDQQLVDSNAKINELSAWGQSLQTQLMDVERQSVEWQSKWETTHKELQEVLGSKSVMIKLRNAWQCSPSLSLGLIRFLFRLYKYGLIDSDRRWIERRLGVLFQKIPVRQAFKMPLLKLYSYFLGTPLTLSASFGVALPSVQDEKEGFTDSTFSLLNQTTGLADYFIWGVIDWHFRIQRPQQLARELAKQGRRVFYISNNIISHTEPGFKIEPLDSSGRLFQISLQAIGAPVIYFGAPTHQAVNQLRASIGEVLEWTNSREIISFIQHPFWYDIAGVLPNSRLVYDCMDHHEGFGNTDTEILSLERVLMGAADLTITTSSWLDKIVAEHTEQRALIRNAGEFEFFSQRPIEVYSDPQNRRIIGYYGAIAEWFDQDLVALIAKNFPDCCLLLVGEDSVNAKQKLLYFPNVIFIGEVPYSRLPYYLYSFDVCLLPFQVIPLTLATNPVKVYEYLSAGKPVLSVDLPEIKQFGKLVKTAKSPERFLLLLADILKKPGNDPEINLRQAFAKEQTWTHRVDDLICHAESTALDPKVSIIVVTYNNLEFTCACLESLDHYSDYHALEIIVVDNASTDGSKAFLSEWVKEKENRQLILNDDNKGFAAANNQGLMIANGEYLVMLNNDTYVTPGWVRSLIKHLQRDKSIGLIGPVTNNIGNEAKIDITYQNMPEMLIESSKYTHMHIGQTFQLRTAAFFCVMMSRAVYERIGLLDEAFGQGFFEDDDYCRRIDQAGLRVVCAEDVFVHHHLSASFNKLKSKERQALMEKNKAIYEAKWGRWVPHMYR